MEKSHLGFDVIIVGGGIVGVTLAACLKRTNLRIAIVEAQPLDVVTQRQRAYAMSLLSQRLFQELGVWEVIAARSGKYRNIQLSDEDFSGVVRFSRQDLKTDFLGFSGQHQVVLETLQASLRGYGNIRWFCPAQVTAIHYESEQAIVELSSETQGQIKIQGALVVGADGPRSLVRQGASIKTRGWKYWQSCVTCVVEHDAPRNDVAFERFWGTGPMGVLPLTENRCQIVWTNPHAEAQRLKELPPEVFLEYLEQHTGPQLGRLKLLGDRQVFPVQLMQGDRYVDHRLALVGDAAHCCHPVGGQGLNLGIRDAAALAQTLIEAQQRGQDLGSLAVLKRYERWRKRENLVILGFTDFLNRLFSNRIWPVVWVRRLGLIVMAKFNPLRLFALKLMTGQKGRQPRILA
ncbi:MULTISPECIES: FAD-dependent hydroxylase [Cyanophyceae]|uniref:FAD-dependent hydroxylase n=1 Tax=Cyanophyceae TaxID=3028117 RepID=UPI00016DCA73|nr:MULTISPECIES: FAD-dependent hydroxylase [Cyanophyceae]ACA99936.1 Ubiquinone biosynthesis hydroxylase, UbiH/UbiF/VisC/COQ6 family [Picosynechococcus sp. PCC 7002]SMH54718.1 2-octaprenyl-6-methoxyphenol hydroxylase [Picosynechococcus sp. OG1]SMQ83021.1 2-octaprenyl-6-methoxyphenol hydroxylase [Synechococcus sp. 7002]